MWNGDIAPIRNSGGQINHFLSIQRNVTERKSAKNRLRELLSRIEKNRNDLNATLNALLSTDQAFAKLPAGTVENLLKRENKDKLTAVLTYHVVPGRVTAAEVVNLSSAKTVNGARFRSAAWTAK
jgi:uncharacterized surface protein with fasciclin (FAS1) repeats